MSLEKNLENTQKEENVVLGIKDVLTKIVKLQVDNADLLVNLLQKDLEKDVFGKNMVNMERENSVVKQKEYVMEKNVKLYQENVNMLVKLLKYSKKNHVLFNHMEIDQVEEDYVVNGQIIVLE